MDIQNVVTLKAPAPAGHYSQAVIHNNTVFISGQLPIIPESGEKILGSIEEQTFQFLKNVKAVAEAAGSDISRILKVTIYISDIDTWEIINKVYCDFFGSFKPSRTIVSVKDLHHRFRIEMDAVAAI